MLRELIRYGVCFRCSYLSELLHRARRQSEERRMLQEISQDELRRSEVRFSTIFHASPMGIDLVQMKDGSSKFIDSLGGA